MPMILRHFGAFIKMCRGQDFFRTCSTLNQYVEVPSALHLEYKHRKTIFQAVSPYLDNREYFEDIVKLHSELSCRGIGTTIDRLNELKKNCQLQFEVSHTYENFKKERDEIGRQLQQIKGNVNQEKKALLLKKLHKCSEQILVVQEKMQKLEKTYILPFLNLPNRLNQSTTLEDVELNSFFDKPSFTSHTKSHLSICRKRKEILTIDVSTNSFYLVGNLAILELAIAEFLFGYSKKQGYRPLVVTDFAKATLAEGCGLDVKSNEEVFEIQDSGCVSSSLKTYLVGGASLPCSVSLMCKLVKNPNFVQPFKSFSVGRKYSPTKLNNGIDLYNTSQSTVASAFILHSCHSLEENKMLDEAVKLVKDLYMELGLHFKLIRYAASNLKKHESLAIGVCMYSPFNRAYVEVGRISLCSDYISKRLQCIEGLGRKKGAFLGMIHVEMINITKWIACMVENTQTLDGNYSVPKTLQPFMFDAKCSFV